MAKKITADKLAEMTGAGARLSKKDKPLVIAQFDQLIKGLESLQSLQKMQIEQQQKLVEAIEKLSSLEVSNDLDLTPIASVIKEVLEAQSVRHDPVDYVFDVERDGSKLTKRIYAKAQIPTKH